MPLHFNLVESGEGRKVNVNVTEDFHKYTLKYPCDVNYSCTNYFSVFPPGVYQIELYGASSGFRKITSARNEGTQTGCKHQDVVSYFGGNVECNSYSSMGGAGGFTSGILTLKKKTLVYIAIGGMGEYTYHSLPNDRTQSYLYENRPKGGFNGGGSAGNYYDANGNDLYSGSSSGGGATDVRILENDIFHRVIVSGGGGGNDNCYNDFDTEDDGSGGGLTAQGFWIAGSYRNKEANQEKGFSFGYGESARYGNSLHPDGSHENGQGFDIAGAGGGWYGGFASQHYAGGACGGSSFVLTKDSYIPQGEIIVYNDMYDNIINGTYAFTNDSPYVLSSPVFVQGIWAGNGKAIITILSYLTCTKSEKRIFHFHVLISVFIFI